MANKGNARYTPDKELSRLFTKMFEEDENKCFPKKDFSIDLQGHVTSGRSHVGRDNAERRLFSRLDERVLRRDTYKAFIALLDNYESELGQPEKVTKGEIKEVWDFINLIMKKKVMQDAHKYLHSKRLAPQNVKEFKDMLCDMWFRIIPRSKGGSVCDSSSFEHVFVGETKKREVKGLHNWLQFYLQEKMGKIDYKGYFTIRNEAVPRLLNLQFTWKKDVDKPISSIFLGTSPEFEIAVYTICRLMNKSKVFIQLGEYETEITCFPLSSGVDTEYVGVGTAYIGAANQ